MAMSICRSYPQTLFAFAMLTAMAARAATTVTLQPDGSSATNGDAFVSARTSPTDQTVKNYGAAGALEISAAGAAKGEFKSVLRFDTSTATSAFNAAYGAGNWAIDSITLQLTVANPANAIFNSNAAGQFLVQWLQDDSWIEGNGTPAASNSVSGAITWNSLAPLIAAGVQSEGTFNYNNEAVGTQMLFTLTSTSGLLDDVLNGTQASLVLSSSTPGTSVLFNSRNNGVAGNLPGLILTASPTASPEPSRALLVVVGILGLAMQRRRRA